ncbi:MULTISPECIES: 2-oxo acid dehydrogenase subunit E2 [unclassified Streptomyces]|uniref:2-oxo acid dehydrogenase subunit E2 n=1 Tax=unclassified Streptomyces TaxID=2593676 RepID=UPI0022519016|nr:MULTISPECIES: 2-oxo acid dehydrogenase subunit E2 [unclassified Streptomyces]MCX5330364.1 2-oxo acid dehydrogenase subunit E2 [Streptomyces sp. NBC_00140]MCX5359763.1 2-oxo acid dehydrogenase subunit E2 [Streptomyces sp. NBC_00124]
MSDSRFPAERRHTLYHCDEIRAAAPVYLDTEVDMSGVAHHRATARDEGRRYSVVSYVLQAAGRVLARHPEANAAVRGRMRPRIARFPTVSGKVTLDKTLGGRRVVLATVVPELERSSLDAVQRHLERFRDGDPDHMPEFAPVRRLHRLPVPVGRLLFRLATRSLTHRTELVGTVAVTSLGHRPVDGFQSLGGTTVTLGVGRVVDRAVVRDGAVVVAPVMRLSLAFDHRVIDGAEAADVLAEIKEFLETYGPDAAGLPEGDRPAASRTTDRRPASASGA